MKKEINSISKNISITYLGNIFIFLITPLLLVLLTRSMSVETYGVYVILSVTISVAAVILDLGLIQYFVSHFSGQKPVKQARYFMNFSVLVASFILILICLAIFITPLNLFLLQLLRLDGYGREFNLGLIIVLFLVLTRMITGYLYAKKEFGKMNLMYIISQTLWIIFLLFFYAIYRNISLLGVIAIWLAGSVITLIIGAYLIHKVTPYDINYRNIAWPGWYIISQGLLLTIFVASSWIMEVGDRYLINLYIGKEAVAQYALGYTLLGIVGILGTLIIQTLIPYISSEFNKKKNYDLYFNAALKYSLLLVIPAAVGFYVLRNEIVTLVSGNAYIAASAVIPYLIVFPVLFTLSYLFGQVLIFYNKKYLFYIYLFGALFNIFLNIILLGLFRTGILGAGIATSLSYLFVSILLYWSIKQRVKIDFRFFSIGKIFFASAIMGIIMSFIHPTHIFTKILTILFGAVLYFIILFLLRIFSQAEKKIIIGMVPGPLKKIATRIVNL